MKKLLVGLDMGSDSVGWCATDENGKIIKKNRKSLWGYLGFDEASAAEDRRLQRGQRRRYNRRKERISLLRDIFKNEIEKVDSSFFYRLDNSFYHNEDREKPFEYTIFNDKNYSDKDYYKNFPTIYHLRKYLLDSNKKEDIRLIYIAMHHMIKYRGNFLNNAEEFKPLDENEINLYFSELNDNLKEYLIEEEGNYDNILEYSNDTFNRLKKINEEVRGITLLKEKYNEILNPNNIKLLKEVIIPIMVGGEISVAKTGLLNIEGKEKEKICAKSEGFDQIVDELLSENSNQSSLIEAMINCKHIYEFFLLGKLLGKNKYLSDAMVSRYDLHHKQLIELKKYVKDSCPEKYNEIFRKCEDKHNNYVAYIGSNLIGNEKETCAHINPADFYAFLKDELGLKGYKGNDRYLLEIISLMDNGDYLLRQNSSNNGVFPYQLNKMEMKKILQTQSKFYPFLLEVSYGFTNIEKIISILEFKIPYYVGPLLSPQDDNNRSKFSWIVRTEEKIYPWNFNKVVNLDETGRNFITRMLNKCSYLNSCYCLPKNSLLFSYFNVLSSLNKTYINGCALTYEDKMDIINNLFKKNRKVSNKQLLNYIISKKGDTSVSIATARNKELNEINYDMQSYYDFSRIFGEDFVKSNEELIENIIRDIVVFEDKSILEKRLISEYGIEDKNIIKQIKGLNYAKYANISKELLTDLVYYDKDDDTGEVFASETIISIMEKTNQNLQEVLFDDRYNFMHLIKEYNLNNSPIENYDSIESYVSSIPFVSPGMKRPLIQAYKICEEIEKITGKRIDEYYVECTRTNKDDNKGKTIDSRQKRLLSIYDDAISKANDEMRASLKEMRKTISEMDPGKFKSDKYYLYFTQMGKCMYTGHPIDIAQLNDDAHYNIDHIYPQSLTKDDSMTNRVLVETSANENKSDSYPIPQSILWGGNYKAAYAFYKQLKSLKLINEEKYRRLVALELTETDMEAFTNRQLVYTNQAVKGFINAINNLKSTDTFAPKIVYSKGENISDFRKKYDLVKSRNANNFHHAHDAYLNIIVGRTIDSYFNYYQVKYGKVAYLKSMHDSGYTTNVMRIFDQNKKNTKKDIVIDDCLIWSYDNSLKEIKKNIYNRFDIFSTERTFCGNELYGKISILKAGEGNIPVKMSGPLSDVSKYGGFKQYAFGTYALIKANGDYIIEPIPTVYRNDIKNYLNNLYNEYEIIIDCLKQNTLLESGKTKYVITGKTGDSYVLKNKTERIFSSNELHIIHKIEKLDKQINHKSTGCETIEEISALGYVVDDSSIVVAPAKNDKIEAIILSNEECVSLYNRFIGILEKDCFDFSASKNIGAFLINSKEKFIRLSILGKVVMLINLLDFLKCNQRKSLDLRLIGGSQNAGVIKMSKKITNCRIVYESLTGYYRKVAFEIK